MSRNVWMVVWVKCVDAMYKSTKSSLVRSCDVDVEVTGCACVCTACFKIWTVPALTL